MTPDETVEGDPTGDEGDDTEEGPTGAGAGAGAGAGDEDTGERFGGWGDDFGPQDAGPPIPTPMSGLGGALGRGVAGGLGQSLVILEPKGSTPLDVAEPGHAVPTSALWAMKYLRHGRYGLSSGDDGPDRIRWASDEGGASEADEEAANDPPEFGAAADGDQAAVGGEVPDPDEGAAEGGQEGAVYVIDDGSDHCMVARLVGASPDGCTYCLVARIKRLDFDDVRAGWTEAADLFAHGKEFTLCGVVEGSVSNVVRVAGYRRLKHVPVEYLPPSPFIEFDETI